MNAFPGKKYWNILYARFAATDMEDKRIPLTIRRVTGHNYSEEKRPSTRIIKQSYWFVSKAMLWLKVSWTDGNHKQRRSESRFRFQCWTRLPRPDVKLQNKLRCSLNIWKTKASPWLYWVNKSFRKYMPVLRAIRIKRQCVSKPNYSAAGWQTHQCSFHQR